MKLTEKHVSCCQGGMTAKVDLRNRSEPSQRVGSSLRNKEGRLGELVLHRDILHRLIREPFRKGNDRRRISRKDGIRKGINLVDGEAERSYAHGMMGRLTSKSGSPTVAFGSALSPVDY